jgi:hypothetical protein
MRVLTQTEADSLCGGAGAITAVARAAYNGAKAIVTAVVSNGVYDGVKSTNTSGGNTSRGQDEMGNMY